MTNQKVQPCIWFEHDGAEAIRCYVGLFPDSELISLSYTPDPAGDETMLASFRICG